MEVPTIYKAYVREYPHKNDKFLDALQKNDKFFAGERRYSHWYQKTSQD